MGAKLCKNLDSKQNPEITHSISSEGSSRIELLKPECIKAKKIKKKKNNNKKRTLEDWLLASPSMKRDCVHGGELCVFKQFSKRVHPSSPIKDHKPIFSKAGETSFSLERLVLLDREADQHYISFSSSSIKRSKTDEPKKRVTFKLPQEADVIIFYSPN